ncbi:MAG: hypothetical protein A2091_11520 [Desulfuromonadales bacterium GWD2_61_12]|nr:MAG: hypothetical protein A2005_07920 [Desulfuromonadales bacterium GWC2_61_20]OGR36383.1 MAG: hypothetical protein A2091_11520 [Desulfuromonadales bacterium GWD2_61_12]HAD03729.1 hypothetical protein [Desulfuromonas sp.]
MVRRWSLIVFCYFLLSGCSAAGVQRNRSVDNLPPPVGESVYVIPFLAVMVPSAIETGILDRLVDTLNRDAQLTGRELIILKRTPAEIDAAWLASHYYIGGELFGFVRDSGCCSTEMRLKARLAYYQPGKTQPTLTLAVKREAFFDHDSSTLAGEEERLINDVVTAFTDELLLFLTPSEKNPAVE